MFRPDFDSLSQNIVNSFQIQLSNRFATLDDISDPETLYENISSAISEVARHDIRSKRTSTPKWMSQNTKDAIENKHKVRKAKGHSSMEYRIAKSESKKLVQKNRLKQVEEELDSLSNLPPS